MMNRSFGHNVIWSLFGSVTSAACKWGTLIVLAKLCSSSIVGQFSLGLAIAAPVIIFSNMQLRAVIATDARSEFEFSDYLGLRLLTAPLALTVVGLFALLLDYDAGTAWVIFVVGLGKAIEAVSEVLYGILQRFERLDLIARAQIIKGLSSFGIFGLSLYWLDSLLMALGTMYLVSACLLLFYERWLTNGVLAEKGKEPIWPRWQGTVLVKITALSLPLGISLALKSLETNVPRYVLEAFTDTDMLGVFAALSYLLVAGYTVFNAVGQAASPRLADLFAAQDKRGFLRIWLLMVGVVLVCGAVALAIVMAFGEPILNLVYTPEYGEYSQLLPILVGGMVLTSLAGTMGYALTAARAFRVQVPLGIVGLICFTGLSTYLIDDMGLHGAAWTLFYGALSLVLSYGAVMFVVLRRRFAVQA